MTLDDLPAVYETSARWGSSAGASSSSSRWGAAASSRRSPRPSPRSSSTGSTASRRKGRFQIKTTEATHYRRVAIRAMEAEGMTAERSPARRWGAASGSATATGSCSSTTTGASSRPGSCRSPWATSAPTTSWPSTVSTRPSPPCATRPSTRAAAAICPFVERCGGSRARAYAWTGDILETDPLCPFVPTRRAEAAGGGPGGTAASGGAVVVGGGITGLAAAYS